MNTREELRSKIEQGKASKLAAWGAMTRHHEDYVRVLALSPDDVAELERQKGRIGMYPTIEDELEAAVLTVETDNETFGVVVKHVCGVSHDGNWANYLMVGCKSNPGLNISNGSGTALIFTVPEDWHNRVISQLTEDSTPSQS
ncbi:MAG: hypothetical protein M1324_03340 [Patescibacteria group bacterium]|nr:hypothetical protein [Patescibacteria group bacterium]